MASRAAVESAHCSPVLRLPLTHSYATWLRMTSAGQGGVQGRAGGGEVELST